MCKPTIILTGAGAVIPWGAPKTIEITHELLNDETFKSTTGQPLADWIFQKLTGFYHKDPQTVNFETVINSIEYFNTFFSSKYTAGFSMYKNFLPAFFQEKDNIFELLWFDRIYEKENTNWKTEGRKLEFYGFWNDYHSFFKQVFRYYINLIVNQIEKYSIPIENKVELNNKLNNFLNSLQNPLRVYTTNYDRIIPKIYNGEMFEGFSKQGEELKFDLNKVLTDSSINSYFNLHGSVHFDMDFPDNVKYRKDEYILDFGSGASDKNDQDHKKLINSNIITGFNKSSRILSNPYSQFFHRFYQDCLSANKLFIIGYSFSDPHINSSIKTALTINKDLKIYCVSYQVHKDENIEMVSENDWVTFSNSSKNLLHIDFKYIIDSFLGRRYYDQILIYRKGFEQFLNHFHEFNFT